MTWKELTVLFGPLLFDLVKAALWPAAIVFMGLLFRRQVGGLLSRLLEGSAWGVNAKFAPPAQQTPEEVKKLAKKVEPKLTLSMNDEVTFSLNGAPKKAEPKADPKSGPKEPVAKGIGPWFEGLEEKIRSDPRIKDLECREQLEIVIGSQAVVQSYLGFERIFNIIFGSQLFALRLADRPGGIPLDDVKSIFESARERFPEFHKSRTFEAWCQFLMDTGLAVELPLVNGRRMAGVTDQGHEFIVYVTQQRYAEPLG